MFNFEVNEKSYGINLPDRDKNNWVVIKEESLKYDKGALVLDSFNKEFPHLQMDSYEKLVLVCGRSRKLSEWLIMANLKYSEFAQMPSYLEDLVEPSEFKIIQGKITSINEQIASYSAKKQKLAEKYKSDLRNLEAEESKKISEAKGDNKALIILSLNQTQLPASLQLAIENYEPSDKTDLQESRRVYAREVLISYKKSLLQVIKDVPEVDVLKLIEENELK